MRAISSMATRQVLAELVAAGVARGLPAVEVESVGGVDAAARVASGEAFDLVFLASGALSRLHEGGHVAEPVPLVLSQVAAAVPAPGVAAAARPDGVAFADASAMQEALGAASRIGYSTGPSGTTLVQMIADWGLELDDRLVQAQPGVPVAASVAASDVDLGFQQLSELVGQPGIRILGVLAGECAIDTVFGMAVGVVSDAASAWVEFLSSTDAAAIKRAHNFGVV